MSYARRLRVQLQGASGLGAFILTQNEASRKGFAFAGGYVVLDSVSRVNEASTTDEFTLFRNVVPKAIYRYEGITRVPAGDPSGLFDVSEFWVRLLLDVHAANAWRTDIDARMPTNPFTSEPFSADLGLLPKIAVPLDVAEAKGYTECAEAVARLSRTPEEIVRERTKAEQRTNMLNRQDAAFEQEMDRKYGANAFDALAKAANKATSNFGDAVTGTWASMKVLTKLAIVGVGIAAVYVTYDMLRSREGRMELAKGTLRGAKSAGAAVGRGAKAAIKEHREVRG